MRFWRNWWTSESARYKVNYSYHYQDTNLVLYQKYTYEDACRLLNWERNEVPLNIGGYKYDKKTKDISDIH